MAEKKSQKKKPQKIIPLDGDKLGMIGGILGATFVLIIGFFTQTGTMTSTLIRMGWVFIACYGATFFLVRMVLRTTLIEMIEEEKAIKRKKKADVKAAKAKAESDETEKAMTAETAGIGTEE